MKMILIPLAFFSLLGCGTKSPFSEADAAHVKEQAHKTLEAYYTAIRERGLLAEFDYLDSTADFFWVPPGASEPLGYDSIHSVLTQNAPRYKSIVNTWDTLSIKPLSFDYALYTGRLRSAVTDTANTTTTVELIETGVLVKRESGWKLLSGQTSVVSRP